MATMRLRGLPTGLTPLVRLSVRNADSLTLGPFTGTAVTALPTVYAFTLTAAGNIDYDVKLYDAIASIAGDYVIRIVSGVARVADDWWELELPRYDDSQQWDNGTDTIDVTLTRN